MGFDNNTGSQGAVGAVAPEIVSRKKYAPIVIKDGVNGNFFEKSATIQDNVVQIVARVGDKVYFLAKNPSTKWDTVSGDFLEFNTKTFQVTKKAAPGTRRFDGRAVVVGKKIYYSGGSLVTPVAGLKDFEVYDTETDTWTRLANLNNARYQHTMALGENGKIYVFSGSTAASTHINVTESYDIAGDTWTVETPATVAKFGMIPLVVGDKIYLIGGSTGTAQNTVAMYDTTALTWTAKTNAPSSFVNSFIQQPAKVAHPSDANKFIVMSGAYSNYAFDVTTETIALHNLGLNLPLLASNANTYWIDSGEIYYFGVAININELSSGSVLFYSFNFADGLRKNLTPDGYTSFKVTSKVNKIGDYLYVTGGSGTTIDTVGVFRFNTKTNEWKTLASYPIAVSETAFAVFNNKLYGFGGTVGSAATDNCFVYNEAENKWTAIASLPVASYRAATAVTSDAIYYMAAVSSATQMTDVYKYTPSNDTWTKEGDMRNKYSSTNVSATFAHPYVYLYNQGDSSTATTVEIFDTVNKIVINAFTLTASVAGYGGGCFFKNGLLYLMQFTTANNFTVSILNPADTSPYVTSAQLAATFSYPTNLTTVQTSRARMYGSSVQMDGTNPDRVYFYTIDGAERYFDIEDFLYTPQTGESLSLVSGTVSITDSNGEIVGYYSGDMKTGTIAYFKAFPGDKIHRIYGDRVILYKN